MSEQDTTPPPNGGVSDTNPNPTPAAPAITAWTDDKGNFVKKDWTDDESLRGKFTSVEALAKSYKSLESMVGKKGVIPPDEHSTPEQISDFYKQLGRPDKADGYDFKKPEDWPKELPYDEGREKSFKEAAHAAGLTQKQVAALGAWANKYELDFFKNVQADVAKNKAALTEELRKDPDFGGDAYEANMLLAKSVAEKFGGADLVNDPAFGDNPRIIKFLAGVGKAISEDKIDRKEFAASGDSAKSQIDAIFNNKSDAYWDAKHPNHDARVQEVSRLFAKAHPEPAKK